MSGNKTLTAILAIISIFLLAAVAFGLTQIDGANNKNTLTNNTIQNNNESTSSKNSIISKVTESNLNTSQSVEASKINEMPKKEVSSTKEVVKPENKLSNIFETANSNPEISIFVSAVKAAGLEDALINNGPLTVFAPNNEAFTKYLPAETLTELQKIENKDKLVGILKGHIVENKFTSNDLNNGQYLPTEFGGQLSVKVADNQYYIDDILVIKPNIESTNGIIHIVNRIIPE